MVYAMLSIGVLGFIVWSRIKMASWLTIIRWFKKLAIGLNNLVLWDPFYRKNFHSYIKWAGNLLYFNFKKIYSDNFNLRYSLIEDPQRLYANSCYIDFYKAYDLYIKKNNKPDWIWLTWLIGFIEGDGAILTHKKSLSIVLTQKDSSVLYHIKTVLGFGIIKEFNGYSRLIFRKNSEIYLMILLLNGNLVLNKRKEQLKLMIDVFNKKSFRKVECLFLRLSDRINFIVFSPNITLNDSWLAGFTDAEGCFNVLIVKRKVMKSQYNVSLRFILDQKDEYIVLENIRNLIGSGKVSNRGLKSKILFRYVIHSLKNNKKVIDYFNKYSLKTTKRYSFEIWTKIYFMLKNKEHLNKEGLDNIRNLRTNMNKFIIDNRKIGSKSP